MYKELKMILKLRDDEDTEKRTDKINEIINKINEIENEVKMISSLAKWGNMK